MQEWKRYAVYYAPPSGAFSRASATWLGWDAEAGSDVAQPVNGIADFAELTAAPRRYGFHGTLKPPFALAAGAGAHDLVTAVASLATRLDPVALPGLRLARIGGFLALVPEGDGRALSALAGRCVADLDGLRAPLTGAERARRDPDRLSPRQRVLLDRWGYPYVMEEFRFHLTLTDRLSEEQAARIEPLAVAHFAPHLPRPFTVGELCIFGEGNEGRFHLLSRHALTG